MKKYGWALLAAGAAIAPLAVAQQHYLHPQTKQQCVIQTNGPQDAGPKYRAVYFENVCDRPFSISATWPGGRKVGNGITRGSLAKPSQSRLLCEVAKGECGNFQWNFR